MKKISGVLKILTLDWFITLIMYISGFFISSLENSKKLNITSYFPDMPKAVPADPDLSDAFMYLFISLSFVMLISYLINKSFLKVGKKDFFIGQVAYLSSFVLMMLGVAFLI